jgi:hypothetical protein
LARPDLAAAGLWTTAVDLAKVAQELRRSYFDRPLAVFPPELVRQMLAADPESLYGLGTVVDNTGQDPRFGHGGEPVGYHGLTICELNSGDGWVVLTNGAAGDRVVRTFVSTL